MRIQYKFFLTIHCIFFIQAVFANSTDPVEGYWKSVEKNGIITGIWHFFKKDETMYATCLLALDSSPDVLLHKCTKKYLGHPISEINLNNRFMRDTPLIFGLRKQAKGEWVSGRIIDARNGRMYICHVSFYPADGKKFKVDTLGMRGEIAKGIGLTQFWQAAAVEEINSTILDAIKRFGSAYTQEHPQDFLIQTAK